MSAHTAAGGSVAAIYSKATAGIANARCLSAMTDRTCDYGGCDETAVGGITHEGKHWFCEYHLNEVNP